MYTGRCLCGQVNFSIQQKIHTIYHCHCSLCRKQSGTGANAATLVLQQNFNWESAKNPVHTYKKDSGFTSSFCTQCGSPVPNQVGKTDYMWIPLGLLENNLQPERRLNFCLQSKTAWIPTLVADQDYAELPEWTVLASHFQSDS